MIHVKYICHFSFVFHLDNVIFTIQLTVKKKINLVFEKEPFWNVKSKSYHNRDVCRKFWNDISLEIGIKYMYIIYNDCNFYNNIITHLIL